jgi:hypothetical protein
VGLKRGYWRQQQFLRLGSAQGLKYKQIVEIGGGLG